MASASDSCIFCKIARNEIPATVVYEDEHALAFLDIRPLQRGHALVIPKAHAAHVQELSPETAGGLGRAVSVVAGKVQRGVGAPASTIAVNNGVEAGQEVPHVHVHVVPRRAGDGFGPIHALFPQRPDVSMEELQELARSIRKA